MLSYDFLLKCGITLFVLMFHLLCYERFSDKTLKINYKSLLIIILMSILSTYNSFYNTDISKLFISILFLAITDKLIFNENSGETIVRCIACYIISAVVEVFVSISFLFLPIASAEEINNDLLFKLICSIVVIVPSYLICSLKCVIKIVKRIISKFKSEKVMLIFIITTLLLLIVLIFKFFNSYNGKDYFLNIVIVSCFSILLLVSISINYKTRKVEQKQEVLLNFMSKYEKMIDEGRINRHEMLNNLLILKSYKNKNSKEYNNTLNELINTYSTSESIKNIYNLPSGLKGVIYYKIGDMQNNKIVVTTRISKDFSLSLKKVSESRYAVICKVAAILLDNAKEAASTSREKMILIELYREKNKLIIHIENTFKGKVEIKKINIMNYSTKGKGRGLGLYIAKSLLNKTKDIELIQNLENGRFISEIIIK